MAYVGNFRGVSLVCPLFFIFIFLCLFEIQQLKIWPILVDTPTRTQTESIESLSSFLCNHIQSHPQRMMPMVKNLFILLVVFICSSYAAVSFLFHNIKNIIFSLFTKGIQSHFIIKLEGYDCHTWSR